MKLYLPSRPHPGHQSRGLRKTTKKAQTTLHGTKEAFVVLCRPTHKQNKICECLSNEIESTFVARGRNKPVQFLLGTQDIFFGLGSKKEGVFAVIEFSQIAVIDLTKEIPIDSREGQPPARTHFSPSLLFCLAGLFLGLAWNTAFAVCISLLLTILGYISTCLAVLSDNPMVWLSGQGHLCCLDLGS